MASATQNSSGILQNKKKSIISWAHAPWASEFCPGCTQRRHSAQRRANFLEVLFRGSAGPGTGAAHFREWPELRHLLQSPQGASRAPPPALVGHLGQTMCPRAARDPLRRPFLPSVSGRRRNSCTLRAVFPAKRLAGAGPACRPAEGLVLWRRADIMQRVLVVHPRCGMRQDYLSPF
uniref:Uncharacterized protein n=1 Tax=Rousettus aegyptiacus TaxID=9407 RepID=A0A7J8D6L6_ROUAE|nr:hypothetical protein HJG63_008831 [Rousettus aegyptiacus]